MSLWNTEPLHHSPVSLLGHRNKVLCIFTATNSKDNVKKELLSVSDSSAVRNRRSPERVKYIYQILQQNVHKVMHCELTDVWQATGNWEGVAWEIWILIEKQYRSAAGSQSFFLHKLCYFMKKIQNRMHGEQYNCATSEDSSLTWGTQLLIKKKSNSWCYNLKASPPHESHHKATLTYTTTWVWFNVWMDLSNNYLHFRPQYQYIVNIFRCWFNILQLQINIL